MLIPFILYCGRWSKELIDEIILALNGYEGSIWSEEYSAKYEKEDNYGHKETT